MGKNKRKTPMSEDGIVVMWKRGDDGGNLGWGFIERTEGAGKIFVHRTQINDGDALKEGTRVQFDARPDVRNPGQMTACNVRGGVCFQRTYRSYRCASTCTFSHADRLVVREIVHGVPKAPMSLEAALAAVVGSRGDGAGPVLVDTVALCREHCDRLGKAASVAVDFEGINLCRDGEMLLAQLAADDGSPTVLIDIYRLQQSAFEEGGLRALLESTATRKLIFDGRADADALFHLHQTRLTNVCDCQVLITRHLDAAATAAPIGSTTDGVATGSVPSGCVTSSRPLSQGRLPGLGKALEACPSLLAGKHGQSLAQLKKLAHALFVPELGGRYEAWKTRPLAPALMEYAAADVAHLHAMVAAWGDVVRAEEMRQITSRRLHEAISGANAAKGPHMAQRDF